jgi:hypothetical protein
VRPRALAPLLLAIVVCPLTLRAEEPDVSGVVASLAGRELRVSARLEHGLPEEVARRLEAGLPTTLVWRVGLFAYRPVWWDGKKGERRYAVTATYRPDSDDVSLERRLDGRLLETEVVRSRAEAARALARMPPLPCFTMGRHLDGKRLVVKVSCRYGTEVSLGVVPSNAETGWTRSKVFVWREPSR